jgi:hypothetical protein
MPTNKFEYTFVVIADNLTPVIPILACSAIILTSLGQAGEFRAHRFSPLAFRLESRSQAQSASDDVALNLGCPRIERAPD